ncbi:type II toxin-antitoxin system RelE family toxin [Allorhizocola rhizosphaerae]|uniref:type II toxin-antitoxin system RelE family toxin n=1 Tax=Allorhizocola rhizosphaerae TaxID=1872709 RepID=UPI000E3D7DCA|nr:type II toxin-antitoxin system RelE/ParE family toxin [Allorhizocola rhizosphaerae]
MILRFHPDVYKQLQQLPRAVFPAVLHQVIALVQEARPMGCKKLVGGGGNDWRVRVGEYRIVYEISDKDQVVTVMRVAHRREVYR